MGYPLSRSSVSAISHHVATCQSVTVGAPNRANKRNCWRTPWTAPSKACLIAQFDSNVLRFQVCLQSFMGQLAAQAAFLHPSEGTLGRGRHRFVDADDACLDALGHLPGDRQIVREDISGQAIARVVRRLDDI